ncbi:ABC-F family ATP-binding cassette domain-containing protein [Halobacteriovorax sp. HLS]|uniref:ABC-F family ATP-binding cassette domain-containing protein n=1 Tax=Halobacteriovorax sp. HLS TaxID=2234000 RepID=UPI000FD9EF9F|nr:ABC-F family ATP-binding cassette domain-containing protein [Halobacteriovorax sp. HLS]
MALLCTLSNIHLNLGTKNLFTGTGFTISYGDRIGLLGLNGQGKSSLFKILADKLKPDHATPPFSFDKANSGGENNSGFSSFLVPQEMNLEVGKSITIKEFFFTFYPEHQKIHSELDQLNLRLETELSDELIEKQEDLLQKLDHLQSWELIGSFESYLKYFGIYDFEADVSLLSGGEQKKILLSLGFTARENLILWDEPTNHLDIETIKLFENELMNSNKTFMLITHDRYLLGKVSSRIFHIQRGMIETFNGSYTDYLDFLSEQEEARKKLLNKLKNSLSREQAWMRQGIKARGTRSKKRVEGFNDLKSKVSNLKGEAKKALLLNVSTSGRQTRSLVELTDVTFSYPGKDVFKDVNLNVYKGDRIGLIGKNGVGKTTLVKLILEELKVTSGKLKNAEDLQIQYFSQKKDEFDPNLTPFDILGDGSDHVDLPDGRKKHIAGYFEDFLFLKDDLHRPIKTLSGGEKSRLQLAKNLTRSADVWIFDEPTNDLDLETLQILEDTLINFKGSLILISHDRSFLSNVTNKTWVIDAGTIEQFVGGYAQAEPYLEALALEHIIDGEDEEQERQHPKEEVSEPEVPTETAESKLNNTQKLRLQELPKLIEKAESSIQGIEKLMLKFNFENMDEDTSKLYSDLAIKKDTLEEELLALYDELDTLNS